MTIADVKNLVVKILSCYRSMPLIMAGLAAASLGMAYMAQYGFGLEPCILCLYQRIPFFIVIGFGLIGFALSFKCQKATAGIMGLIGLSFIANSIIAFYHTGVEQKWWPSHLEGCAVPEMTGDMTQILAEIQSRTKAVRCDEIPWADPIFNLSMANYNVIFCLGLGIIAIFSARLICKNA